MNEIYEKLRFRDGKKQRFELQKLLSCAIIFAMKLKKEMRLATIIKGSLKGEYGCVMVEFTDGDCIIDIGNNRLIYEKVSNLSFWMNDQYLEIKDGKIVNYERA